MRSLSATFALIAITSVSALSANAVCIDDAGISGYHIPLEKEFREAYAVVIGTVVGVKEGPAPLEGEDWEDTVYRLRVEETLRGQRHKTFALFSENTSARFPMQVGGKYLVFVHRRQDKTFYASNCGSSGELNKRSKLVAELRKRQGPRGKG